MNIELKLALQAIDEIEDLNRWKEAFLNTIAECTLQVELKNDKENFSHLASLKDNELIESCPKVFQNVCMMKLVEYKEKIFEQSEILFTKEEETAQLYEENNHLREINNSFAENIEKLKKYLEAADIANITLRSENTDLLQKVRNLERSISNIENKSAEVVDKIIAEESEKQIIQINNLEELISRQNNVIQKLQKDIEDYDLLKSQNENLLKENKTIDPLKKEISRLESALSQFYKDYQDLIGMISHEPGSCAPSIEIKKDEGISNRSKNSTTTSRNVIESDDESQNKNITLNRASLTPKETSHKQNMSSLMEEIIITKFSGTPVSGTERRSNPKSTEFAQQQKINTPKPFKSIDMTKKTKKKGLHSNSLQIHKAIKNYNEGLISEYNTDLTEELHNEGDFAKKAREIIASELGSEDEREEEKLGSDSSPYRESSGNQELINMFEDEKILLSWDEDDFKRLPSISAVSHSKKSSQYVNDALKEFSVMENNEGFLSNRRTRAISGIHHKIYAQTTGKKISHRRSETTGQKDIMSLTSSIIKNNKLRKMSLGFLLKQKLSNLKSGNDLQAHLLKQELDVHSLQNYKELMSELEINKQENKLENFTVFEDQHAESIEATPRRFSFQYMVDIPKENENDKPLEKKVTPAYGSIQTYLLTPGEGDLYGEQEKVGHDKIIIEDSLLINNTIDKETQTNFEGEKLRQNFKEEANNKPLTFDKEIQVQTEFYQTDDAQTAYLMRENNNNVSIVNKSTPPGNGTRTKNPSIKEERGLLTSVVLTALPLVAGASLTYLYFRKKNK